MSIQYFIKNFKNNKSEQNTLINKKKYIFLYKTSKCTAFKTDIMIQFAFSMNIFANISKSTFRDLEPISTKVCN